MEPQGFLSRLLMKIKFLSWNVRGANDAAKRKVIKAFIKMQRVDVVCQQDTKFKEVYSGLIRNLGVGRFLDWAALRAEGALGGIIIFWDSRVLKLLAKEEGQFTVSCRFKFLVDDCTWVFTSVYGPTAYGIREHLWDELRAIRGLWSDPWCIRGDFNITQFPNERIKEGRITGSMRRFSQVIDDLELRDFPVQGG